ncbi:MAG: ABC transporter permease [Ruminococcus sp.]|nr:ABC transporter permease [Ruminococcus sp.]
MMSTASFKEKFKQAFSIFKWDLKSCSGTLVVYSIIASAMTVIILTLALTLGFTAVNSSESSKMAETAIITVAMQSFQIASAAVIYILTIIFTIFYTVKVFSYLHNKRKADLYGSLPISRVTLFTSKSAVALLFSMVPAMFFMGLISLITILFGQPVIAEVTDMYVKLIIGSLASISFYGLISVCCGTTINAVIMFSVVCFAYPLSTLFIKGVIGAFIYGFNTSVIGNSFIINALNPIAAYEGANILYWLIFTAACLVGAGFLVKKRKAERAQSSFAYFLPCHIVKVIVAFLVGMILGVLFGSLNVLGGFPGFIFGFIVGSVPAFIIAHLVFYKGFSQLIKTSIPLGGLIVVVIIGVALCNFDVFGYSTYVPHKDEVVSAGFIDMSTFYGNPKQIGSVSKKAAEDFTDDAAINTILNNHSKIIGRFPSMSSQKFIAVWYSMLMDNFELAALNFDEGDACAISYKLKNGSTVTRYYSFGSLAMYESFAAYEDQLVKSTLINSKQYINKYSRLAHASNDTLQEIRVYGNNGEKEILASKITANKKDNKNLNKENIDKILEAYRKDFEADTKDYELALWVYRNLQNNYSYDDYDDCSYFYELMNTRDDAVCQLTFEFKTSSNIEASGITSLIVGNINSNKSESFIVPKSYTNTIKVLKEIGVLDDSLCISDKSDYFEKYFSYEIVDDIYSNEVYSEEYIYE